MNTGRVGATGNLLYTAGSSNPALCDKLQDWDRVGGRREIQQGGEIYTHTPPMADSC